MATGIGRGHPIDPRYYWMFQIAGWSGFTVVFYLSLTLWYNPGQWPHAIHTVTQSVLGFVISHPLGAIVARSWRGPVWRRSLVNAVGIVVAALIWTVARLATFEWLTGEHVNAEDYGGWLFASLIVYACWVVCYHAFVVYFRWLEERELTQSAEREARQANEKAKEETIKRLRAESLYQNSRLKLLKNQINPHFLFNALNSVSFLAQKNRNEDVIRAISLIANFMRVSLDHDEDLDHDLEHEIDIIKMYLAIEKIRFEDRLDVNFHTTAPSLAVRLPYLLLQPLVENAIKYAVSESLCQTRIELEAWIEDEHLEIRVRDTGPGDPSLMEQGNLRSGIGLRNVRQRLQATYGDQFSFRIEPNTPQGLCVAISIPERYPEA